MHKYEIKQGGRRRIPKIAGVPMALRSNLMRGGSSGDMPQAYGLTHLKKRASNSSLMDSFENNDNDINNHGNNNHSNLNTPHTTAHEYHMSLSHDAYSMRFVVFVC